MPEEVNSTNPTKKNKLPKILLICAICVIISLIIGAIAVGVFFYFNKSSTIPSTATTDRVRGNAGEFYPYGDVQADKDVASLIGPEGGVLTVNLAKDVKAYLIVPPGYSSVDGDIYKLTPYFSMPTSKNAPALPTDLGYGVDFEIENNSQESIEPLYLVFDLDKGKTVQAIAKDSKVNTFCLPTIPDFNPIGCALLKGIPLENHTNTKYGVVSPVRDVDHNDLMFMNSTIPIGYDNLIVTQITNQATFIPIVLSQDVLTDVVRADKPGYTIPLIEAMVQAVNNNIYYNDPETYYNLNKAFDTSGDMIDTNKALQILPKYKDYLNGLKTQASKFANANISADAATNYVDLQLGDYDGLSAELKSSLITNLLDKAGTSSSKGYQTLSAVLQVRRLSLANFPQANETKSQMLDKILNDVAYYVDPDTETSVNNNYMLDSAIWGMPNYFPKVKTDAEKASNLSLILKAYATDSSILPSDAPQAWRDFIAKVLAEIKATLKDPCAHSDMEILKAIQLAQLIGREDLANELIQSLEDRLISNLRSGFGNSTEWGLAMMFGIDNDYSCVNDLYQNQIQQNAEKLTCTTLMDKNLHNFGENEVECKETLLPTDPPVIPTDCKLPDPPKCVSQGN